MTKANADAHRQSSRQRQSGRGRRSRQEQQEVSRARNSIECVCALNAAIIAVPGEGVEREWGGAGQAQLEHKRI